MENVRVHSGLGANDSEYRCEGTSHWQPGYVLSRQVPPTSPARSRTMKSSTPCCLRRMAMPSPAKPEPITATGTCAGRVGAERAWVSELSVVIVLWYSVVPIGTVRYHDGGGG